MESREIISEEKIMPLLDRVWKNIKVFGAVGSTNDIAKAEAKAGQAEYSVYIADSQTSGRGRSDHKFYSPQQTGLYMSVILRPEISMDKTVYITTAAAVAVAEAIEKLSGKKTGIKWVNDIYIGGKKVSGILTEASYNAATGNLDYAVLGIGVNVFAPRDGFPTDISEVAGSVFDVFDDSSDIKLQLAAEILNRFSAFYTVVYPSSYFDSYRRRCFVIGKEVKALIDGDWKTVFVKRLTEDFHLEVEMPDKSRKVLSSGEVSITV